jgi:hypothetical protein
MALLCGRTIAHMRGEGGRTPGVIGKHLNRRMCCVRNLIKVTLIVTASHQSAGNLLRQLHAVCVPSMMPFSFALLLLLLLLSRLQATFPSSPTQAALSTQWMRPQGSSRDTTRLGTSALSMHLFPRCSRDLTMAHSRHHRSSEAPKSFI